MDLQVNRVVTNNKTLYVKWYKRGGYIFPNFFSESRGAFLIGVKTKAVAFQNEVESR